MRSFFIPAAAMLLIIACGDKKEKIACVTAFECPEGMACVDGFCTEEGNIPDTNADSDRTEADTMIDQTDAVLAEGDTVMTDELFSDSDPADVDTAVNDEFLNDLDTAFDGDADDDAIGGDGLLSDDGETPDLDADADFDSDICVPADCATLGFTCGGPYDDTCGGTVETCGQCDPPTTCGGGGTINQCGIPTPLDYPDIPDMRIKGLQPDFWPNYDEIAGNGVGRVAMNMVWASWEPAVKAPPCDPATEFEFKGRCYIPDAFDTAIREYSQRGIQVTGVVYGVPAWARTGNTNCSPAGSGFEIFCSADDPAEFARFAGMLAFRFNGLNGYGRIIDFVIHNEVNSNVWYDVGCGSGTACDKETWIQRYASDFNAAYDAITLQQPTAKVLISFEHHFGSTFEDLTATYPTIAVENFILSFAQKTGSRQWRTAFHSYPPDLRYPQFGINDWPRVTFGNLGVLAGFLRRNFPASPWAWEIQLTENGISSHPSYSSEALQAQYLCTAFRNILGTPGITNFIYHRMKDHPVEVADGLSCGLATDAGVLKQAWSTFALANRDDLTPAQLFCGFEYLPYIVMRRSSSTLGHWVTTRTPPDGFTDEAGWRILRHEEPGTALLYECKSGDHAFPSFDPACEGQFSYGPMGWVYTSAQNGTIPLYRCRVGSNGDHFVSSDAACEGHIVEQPSPLGWVLPLS